MTNLPLLPSKVIDSFVGRQTGLLLYFPVSILVLGLLFPRISWRGAIVIAGLLAYLTLNWLVFPMNGYGGGGSYGPRYTMQALGIILLAFLVSPPRRNGYTKSSTGITVAAVAAIFASFVLQMRVLPPRTEIVAQPHWILQSRVAAIFPIESALSPQIQRVTPPSFSFKREDGRGNHVYMVDGEGEPFQTFHLDFGLAGATRDIVLWQDPRSLLKRSRFPAIGLMTTRAIELDFLVRNETIGSATLTPEKVEWIDLSASFPGPSYKDAHEGWFSFERVTVRGRPILDRAHNSVPAWVDFCLGDPNDEKNCFPTRLKEIPPDIYTGSISLPLGWHKGEDWGVWSRGGYSTLSVPAPEPGHSLQLEIETFAYTPQEAPSMDVDVTVNGTFFETWFYQYDSPQSVRTILIPPQLMDNQQEVTVGFRIRDPRSPASVGRGSDTRELGLGLIKVTSSSQLVR